MLYGFLKGSLFEQMKLAVLEKWEGVYNKGKNGRGTKYWGEYMYIKMAILSLKLCKSGQVEDWKLFYWL